MQKFKIIISVLIVLCIFNFLSILCPAENSLGGQKTFEMEPADAKSYYNLGISYYAEGNYKKAIYNLEKAKEMYRTLGDFKAALEIENYINTLSIKEAFEEVNRKINDLVKTVESLKSEITVLSNKIDNIKQ
jgi:tetratricopeptide (TPR) repeat protein